MRFIGREDYLAKLDALWRKREASFAVVSGRRRIGKSTLVEEFARRSRCRFVEIAGLPPGKGMSNQIQIGNFCERLAAATGLPEARADCWAKAFDALVAAVDSRERTVVFLDEISWMGRYDPAFPGILKTAWDTRFSRKAKLVFVVAGSVSAWIQENIQHSKGYVGRISLDLTLSDLSLRECLGFWGRKAERTSTREILDILSVTGGVPKYLSEIDAGLSADENVRRLCFDPDGYLYGDFNRIFDDVFDATVASKRRIVAALADGAASASELAERFGSDPNGHLSSDLRELSEAGFVAASGGLNPHTGRTVREVRYRLRDNYTRFYLKYVLPRKAAIESGAFRYTPLDSLPGWDAIMGLQFENLVLNNFAALASEIGIVGKSVDSVAPYFRRGGRGGGGVQIDMLVQLPKCVYVVETKRRGVIGVDTEAEVQRKIDRLALPKGKSVKAVLVYDGILATELEEDGFFDFLIPAERLMR
ncbi:MAG: ATP-binding protein [Kiritimatiellae bacterium]|nr:ATP-binding protein [Kiritimatiellia bacterium]